MDSHAQIRKAVRDDSAAFLSLVDALAEYEKLPPPDAAAKSRLIDDMCSMVCKTSRNVA